MVEFRLPFKYPIEPEPEPLPYSQYWKILDMSVIRNEIVNTINKRNVLACDHIKSSKLGRVDVINAVINFLERKLRKNGIDYDITVRTPAGFVYPRLSKNVLMIDMKNGTLQYGETKLAVSEELIFDTEEALKLKKKTKGYIPGAHCELCDFKNCPYRKKGIGIVFIPHAEPIDLSPVYEVFNDITKKAFHETMIGIVCPLYQKIHAKRGGLGREAFYAVYTALALNITENARGTIRKKYILEVGDYSFPVFDMVGRTVVILPRNEGPPHPLYSAVLSEIEDLIHEETLLMTAPYFNPPLFVYPRIPSEKGNYLATLPSGKPRITNFCEEMCDIKCDAYMRYKTGSSVISAITTRLKEASLRATLKVSVRPATIEEITKARYPIFERLFLTEIFKENVEAYPETELPETDLIAFIDTGSPETLIHHSIVDKYGIPPLARGLIAGIGGNMPTYFYAFRVCGEKCATLLIAEIPYLFDGKYKALIGMDFIKKSGEVITIKP